MNKEPTAWPSVTMQLDELRKEIGKLHEEIKKSYADFEEVKKHRDIFIKKTMDDYIVKEKVAAQMLRNGEISGSDMVKALTPEDWPKMGDKYYTYFADGDVQQLKACSVLSGNRKKNYMCFRTREDAELSMKQGLAYRMLWAMSDPDGKWTISRNKRGRFVAFCANSTFGMPRFTSKRDALEAVENISTELLDTIFR